MEGAASSGSPASVCLHKSKEKQSAWREGSCLQLPRRPQGQSGGSLPPAWVCSVPTLCIIDEYLNHPSKIGITVSTLQMRKTRL